MAPHGATSDIWNQPPDLLHPFFKFSFVPADTRFDGAYHGFPSKLGFYGFWLAFFVVWLVFLAIRDRSLFKTFQLKTEWKVNHIIPSVIQLTLFLYWGLYWSPIWSHFPVMFHQLVFAYLFQFCISLTLRRPYVFNLALIPLVLSINFVVWYPDQQYFFYFVVVAAAILSKELIRYQGRHLFNPSAFGMTLVGLIVLLDPVLDYTAIAVPFTYPPNMAELICVLFFLPQFRFNMALVPAGAAIGTLFCLDYFTQFGGVPHFIWAPQFLTITLFASDPMTIPRSQLGRFMFGLTVGLSMMFFSKVLHYLNYGDFYGKIFCVAFANLLNPLFDKFPTPKQKERALAFITPRIPKPVSTRVSLRMATTALWFFCVYEGFYARHLKPFDEPGHASNHTRFVVFSPDGFAHGENNPVFTQPFSFLGELGLWLGGRQPAATPSPVQTVGTGG